MRDGGVSGSARCRGLTVLLTAAALTGLSAWLQSGLTPESAAPFLRALRWLLLAGALLLCDGITRRRQGNGLFSLVCGGTAVAAWMLMFLLYGGMEDMSIPGTETALSLMSCLWTALAVTYAVRAAAVCFGRDMRDEPAACRITLRVGAAALPAVIAVLIAVGCMLRFFYPAE